MGHSVVYGFPCVIDPNDFSPDMECSSPEEREAHALACRTYGTKDYQPNKGCYSEHGPDGQLVKHVTRTSWGIGVNLIPACDGCHTMDFEGSLMTCHECGGPEFCETCWSVHEKEHDEKGA